MENIIRQAEEQTESILALLRTPSGAQLATHNGSIYLANLVHSSPLSSALTVYPLGSNPSVEDLLRLIDSLGLMPELDSLRELVEQLQQDLATMHDLHADALASSSEKIIELRGQLADLAAEVESRRFRLDELFKERDGYVDQVEAFRQKIKELTSERDALRDQVNALRAQQLASPSATKPVVPDRELPGKRCKVCKEVKPLRDYYSQSGTKDGLRALCKACDNDRKRKASARSLGLDELEPFIQPEGGYTCPTCDRYYSFAGYFRNHINDLHGGKLPPLSGVRPEAVASMVPSAQEVAPAAPFAPRAQGAA